MPMLSRRAFWFVVFIAAALFSILKLSAAERPNVIFLRTDDQARWAVGINGNKDIHTPNMDRLHREGANFVNAFVTTPVCSPSRVALLTGIHGIQAGITEYIRPKEKIGIKPEFVTWPELFQKAGYATAHLGKWHLGHVPEFHPTRHGFDHFMGFLVGGTQPMAPELEIEGKLTKLPGVCLNDFLIDEALRFVREHRSGPFLLMVDFRSPHTPYGPETPQDTALYTNANLKLPDVPGIDRKRCLELTRQYYAAISSVDRNIGRLLGLLDELKLVRNTIVVFTSDHGYMLGHHGLWHKGNAVFFPAQSDTEEGRRRGGTRRPNMFDDSLRVPLAIRWPARIKAGTVIEQPVQQIDFYPSLLSLAGIPLPSFAIHAARDEIINVGDQLTIQFAEPTSPIPPFVERVKEDGTVTLLYNERFNAAGKTVGELEADIRARYVPRFFAQFTVIVKTGWPQRPLRSPRRITAETLAEDFRAANATNSAVELPAIQQLQGLDFSPLLTGAKIPWRTNLFFDYDMQEGKESRMRAVRTKNWKLIKHYEESGGEDELYDLRKDPGEKRNLFSSPPKAAHLDSLERELSRWQQKVNDPMLASPQFRSRAENYLDR